MRRSLGIESGLGRDVDEELERDAEDLLDALPLLMNVMQNVGDVFSGEEIAMNMQEDIAKSSAAHDTVDDEVETYGKLRRLVRLDKFSEPDQFVHVLSRLADENTCTILHALVGSLATPNPGGQPENAEAQRQLIYFCNSLHNRRLAPPPPLAKMKSFSSFTPYYNEDVTYTAADLNNKYQSGSADGGTRREAADEVAGGDEDNLHTLLKALFKDEWENFVERVEVDTATVRVGAFREGELGRWASDRGQLLSRTIRGVMLYADGLRVLGRLEGVDEEELEWLVSQKFEYVVTAQRYGAQKRGQQGASSPPDLQKAAAIETLDMNQDNYMGESYKMRNLLECFRGDVRIVGFREHIFSESGGAVAALRRVERVRLRHDGAALPDVAAEGALPLRPPRRVGQRLLRDDPHVDVVGLPLCAHQRAPRHDEHGVVRAVRVRRRHGQRQEL